MQNEKSCCQAITGGNFNGDRQNFVAHWQPISCAENAEDISETKATTEHIWSWTCNVGPNISDVLCLDTDCVLLRQQTLSQFFWSVRFSQKSQFNYSVLHSMAHKEDTTWSASGTWTGTYSVVPCYQWVIQLIDASWIQARSIVLILVKS